MLRLFIITQLLFVINTKDHNEKSIIQWLLCYDSCTPPSPSNRISSFRLSPSIHPFIWLLCSFSIYCGSDGLPNIKIFLLLHFICILLCPIWFGLHIVVNDCCVDRACLMCLTWLTINPCYFNANAKSMLRYCGFILLKLSFTLFLKILYGKKENPKTLNTTQKMQEMTQNQRKLWKWHEHQNTSETNCLSYNDVRLSKGEWLLHYHHNTWT